LNFLKGLEFSPKKIPKKIKVFFFGYQGYTFFSNQFEKERGEKLKNV